MRLAGNFYKVHTMDQIDNDYKVEVELMASHPIYEGHFPQQPVVPGVCTLTIIRECLGEILSRGVSFKSIKDCKYVSALIPQEDLRIILNIAITDQDKINVTVIREDNQQPVLKLKATIE